MPGSGASAYQELYLLLAVYTAAVHPPRRVAPFLLVLSVAACLPLLYQGWTSATAADLGGAAAAVARAVGDDDDRDRAAARAAHGAAGGDASIAQELALQDPLTGLGNRRRLMADLEQRMPPATAERPLLLAMFDLDGFKAYNDTYGHPTGDALLKRLGDKLAATMAGRGPELPDGRRRVLRAGDRAAARTLRETVDCAAQALSEHGDGFSVACLLRLGRCCPHEQCRRPLGRAAHRGPAHVRAEEPRPRVGRQADRGRAAEGAVRALRGPRRPPARRDGAVPGGRRAAVG